MRAATATLCGTLPVLATGGRIAVALTVGVALGGVLALCWVISSNARTNRLVKIILAVRRDRPVPAPARSRRRGPHRPGRPTQ